MTVVSELILTSSCCRDFRFRPQILRRGTSKIRDAEAWAAVAEEGAAEHHPAVEEEGAAEHHPAVEVLVLEPGLEVTGAPRVLAPLAPPPTPASLTARHLLWKIASSAILGKV